MKFTLALVSAAAANTETGIKMLQQLNSMDQSIENMQNVKTALVQCAVAGNCSAEAAAMPSLAMAANTTAEAGSDKPSATATWDSCLKSNTKGVDGVKECDAALKTALNGDEVKWW